MSPITRHTYALKTPAMDAELRAYSAIRQQTLHQEYDKLAAIAVAQRTPWERMRVDALRLTLGITGAAS